jgi:plasmid stability protein
MPDILVRNLSPETHRALRARASRHGRSTAAEARVILDEAVRSSARFGLGTALAALVHPLGGLPIKIDRDRTPAKPPRFE